MIVALLLAAASAAPVPPIVPYAEGRSIAYRSCVTAQRARRAAPVAEIGRGACGRARSRLLAEVRDHVGYGWLATAKTPGQSRRMRAQLRENAEQVVARYDADLQAWLGTAQPQSLSRK
jgi:hypothetical protein